MPSFNPAFQLQHARSQAYAGGCQPLSLLSLQGAAVLGPGVEVPGFAARVDAVHAPLRHSAVAVGGHVR